MLGCWEPILEARCDTAAGNQNVDSEPDKTGNDAEKWYCWNGLKARWAIDSVAWNPTPVTARSPLKTFTTQGTTYPSLTL